MFLFIYFVLTLLSLQTSRCSNTQKCSLRIKIRLVMTSDHCRIYKEIQTQVHEMHGMELRDKIKLASSLPSNQWPVIPPLGYLFLQFSWNMDIKSNLNWYLLTQCHIESRMNQLLLVPPHLHINRWLLNSIFHCGFMHKYSSFFMSLL